MALKEFLFHQEDQEDLMKQILLCKGLSSLLINLQEGFFEDYAHQLLWAGGKFTMRSLEDEKTFDLVITKRKLGNFMIFLSAQMRICTMCLCIRTKHVLIR